MEKINSKEIWRQIPPEEKFALMSRAHAKGFVVCIIAFIVASTIAVALQLPWFMWGALLLSPFIFQFAAGKEWRGLRPRVMLEYLAARAAARRYAFTIQSKDLALNFMFRGILRREFENDEGHMKELEWAIEHNKETEVWVALFKDSLVLMSECKGGARVEFAHLLDDKFSAEGRSDSGEYSSDREVVLSYEDKREGLERAVLTSKYPAALVVFEKKLQGMLKENQILLSPSKARAMISEPEPDLDFPEEDFDAA